MRGALPLAAISWGFIWVMTQWPWTLVLAAVAGLLACCVEAYAWIEEQRYEALRKRVRREETNGDHHRP
jgi:hypothetical protein